MSCCFLVNLVGLGNNLVGRLVGSESNLVGFEGCLVSFCLSLATDARNGYNELVSGMSYFAAVAATIGEDGIGTIFKRTANATACAGVR